MIYIIEPNVSRSILYTDSDTLRPSIHRSICIAALEPYLAGKIIIIIIIIIIPSHKLVYYAILYRVILAVVRLSICQYFTVFAADAMSM